MLQGFRRERTNLVILLESDRTDSQDAAIGSHCVSAADIDVLKIRPGFIRRHALLDLVLAFDMHLILLLLC